MNSIDRQHAASVGLRAGGILIRPDQPAIAACHAMLPFIPNFVEVACVRADGQRNGLIVRIDGTRRMPRPG